jgi:hypothetical protein
LNPHLRERMLGNGETFLGTKIGAFEPYQPDEAALTAIEVPVRVMVETESASFFAESARWPRRVGPVLFESSDNSSGKRVHRSMSSSSVHVRFNKPPLSFL